MTASLPTPSSDARDHAAVGHEVLLAEANTLAALARMLDREAFGRAVEVLLNARAHVIVTGMGKSGHIAAKVASTLASTGTPAFYLHPGEAVHGDLGMVTGDNVLLAISHSGSTEELLNLLPYASQLHIPLIAVTGRPESPLAKRADVVLRYHVDQEADPLNLAPTASCVAQLALGDALAGALTRARGFTPEDFAVRHPLGSLGRRLLMKVSDLMAKGPDLPCLLPEATLQQVLHALTRGRLGAVCFADEVGRLAGIFTDGDLRRMLERGEFDLQRRAETFITHTPKRIRAELPAVKALDLMETPAPRVTVLPVVDAEENVVGMIHVHMLIQAGIGG